jgi:hypothetical protein
MTLKVRRIRKVGNVDALSRPAPGSAGAASHALVFLQIRDPPAGDGQSRDRSGLNTPFYSPWDAGLEYPFDGSVS